jgi:hypothetical protein
MPAAKRNLMDWFLGIGVVMTLASLAVVLASNTGLVWPLEHTGFPLSWMLAGAAILAFLATELCHDDPSPLPVHEAEEEEESSQLTPEWEAVEL